LNKVVLRGVLSDAPRTRVFDDGRKLVNLNVKTVTIENDEKGAMRERPAWHRVGVGGERNAETAERLTPDSPVYVEGRLRTRKYRNQEGEDVYFTEVRADIVRETESADPHVNRSIVLGNLGQTPELRRFDSFMVMNLRVATSESWSRRDGVTGEETEWHQVAVFGEPAQRLEGQLEKGQRVLVEGMLQTRKYNDRSGRERRVTETRAHSVLGSGSSRRSGHEGGRRPPAERSVTSSGAREERRQQDAWGSSGVNTSDETDEVPF
jgi:single-strand DNA-binding protein